MARCGRCNAGEVFLYDCEDCGGQYCSGHQAPDRHLCIRFPSLGGDGPTDAGVRSGRPPSDRLGRATRVVPAGLWLLAVHLVDHLGVRPGVVGTIAIVAFGSVSLWFAAVSIPRVDTWVHAGG